MDLASWKAQLPPVLNQVCREVRVDDAIVDWIDIIFEQTGGAAKCPPHMHAWFEFNYVLEGEMETGFGGSLVPIRIGEFFLVPPDTVHEHVYRRRQPHEGLCLRWRIRRASEPGQSDENASLYKRLERLKDWTPGSYRDRYGIRELIMLFLEGAAAGRSVLSLQLTLVQLLVALTLVHQPDEQPPQTPPDNPDQLLKKVDIYLQDQLGGRLNVEALAASLHMSYGHLSRLYRKRTGYTIVERMNEIRLEKAGRLLRSTTAPIKLVAEQAGYADLPYFNRAFRKKHGVSPSQYRSVREEPKSRQMPP